MVTHIVIKMKVNKYNTNNTKVVLNSICLHQIILKIKYLNFNNTKLRKLVKGKININ